MAESSAQHIHQIVKHPYFIPAVIVLPLSTYFLYSAFKPKVKLPPSAPHKCRFRTDSDSSATITLSDGRKFGYAEYGSPNGRAIIGVHGHPGSRLEWAYWDDLGKKYNARIIGIDRPGIGRSTWKENAKVVDLADDIQQLTEHLKLKEYAVMGCSGGGPGALACAHSLPASKLKGVSVVVGVGEPGLSWKGADLFHRLGFEFGLQKTLPWVTRQFWRQQLHSKAPHMEEEDWLTKFNEEFYGADLHPKDQQMANDPDFRDDVFRVTYWGMREAFVHGVDYVADGGKVMCSDWGMKVADIRPELPLQLWYGQHDTFVPPIVGEQTAQAFKGKAELHIEDETHGSLQWNCQERILTDLLRTFEK